MRRRQFDGVKHDALVFEHMLINVSIHIGRAALYVLYNRDAAVLTLAPLGSIQTGRASVKSTASLLYEIFDATRPV